MKNKLWQKVVAVFTAVLLCTQTPIVTVFAETAASQPPQAASSQAPETGIGEEGLLLPGEALAETPVPTTEPTPAATPEPTALPEPTPVEIPEPAVTPEPTPEGTAAPTAAPTEEPERQPKDFTNNSEAFQLLVGRFLFANEQGAEAVVSGETGLADLSALKDESLASLVLELAFRVNEGTVKEDCFTVLLPKTVFTIKDTEKPQPVYNRDAAGLETGALLGAYEVKENLLRFTFAQEAKEIPPADINGRIPIAVTVTGQGEQKLLLQDDTQRNIKSECTVLLPAAEATPAPEEKPKAEELVKRGLRLAAPMAAEGNSYTGNSYKYTFQKGDAALPDGFASVKITATNIEGGYNNATLPENRKVKFSFEMLMDDDFLYQQFEQLVNRADFPMQGATESDEDYNARMAEWLNDLPDEELPPLAFTYSLEKNFSDFNREETPIVDAEGLAFGSYAVTNGTVNITLEKEIYAYLGVFANFSFEAELDEHALSGKDEQEIVIQDGKIIEQNVGTAGSGGSDPEESKYKVEKDGPAFVKTTTIPYTVNLKGDKDNLLDGKVFVDYLPPGLEVLAVELNGTPLDAAAYTVADDKLQYTFPADGNVETASFEITLGLDAEEYQKLVNSNSVNKSFTNQAALLDQAGGKPLTESEEITTQMNVSYLKKQGSQDSLSGLRYRWTVDATTRLPDMKYGYLVDSLCTTYHKYDFDAGITIDGITYNNSNITTVDAGNLTWDNLTAEDLNKLAPKDGNAFFFTYDGTDEKGNKVPNPFKDIGNTPGGEEEFVQIGVLVIPFMGHQGGDTDKTVQMKYFTDVNLHGLSTDAYFKTNAHKEVSIENVVNLLWENEGGIGPGPGGQPDSVSFGKEVDDNVDILEKKGVSYNPKTRDISWKLTVNKVGANLKNVVITDEMAFMKNAPAPDIQYVHYKDKAVADTGTLAAGLYTWAAATGLLTISLGDVPQNEFYILTIKGTLTDTTLFGTQGSKTLDNTASIGADIDGLHKTSDAKGSLNIPNLLIEKRNRLKYNYATHELFWEVTVNPNSLTINNAVVTDTLPGGTSFTGSQLSEVLVNGTPDITLLAELQGQTTGTHTDKMTFTLGDISTPVTLRFATTITDTFRDNPANKFIEGVSFKNQAELTGDVMNEHGDSTMITDATANSTQTVKDYNLSKKGKYDKEGGFIAWEVLINAFGKDISGTTFEELVYDGKGDRIQELRIGSLELREVTLGADGSYTEGDKVDLEGFTNYTQNADKFSFDFPASTGRQSYLLRFTTDLRDEAAASDAKISNTVTLKGGTPNLDDSSNTSDGSFSGGFDLNEAAGRNPRPQLTLYKQSSNSVGTGDGYLLDDAIFSLEAFEIKPDGDVDWTKALQTYDKVRISNGGKAVFLNIMPSDTMVYRLTETQAPAGYTSNAEPMLYVFATSETSTVTVNNSITFNWNNKEWTKVPEVIRPESAGYPKIKVKVTNTPKDSEFTFTKLQPASNNEGGAVTSDKPLEDAEFSLTPTDDLAGKVETKYATSNANGKVSFQNLDKGTYTLKELVSGTNVAVGGTCTLTVAWDSTKNQYTYTLSGGSGFTVDDTAKEIKDDYVRGNVEFTKYFQFTDPADTRDREVMQGVKFTLSGTVAGTSSTYETSATSDTAGKVAFTNVPVGTYTLTETTPTGADKTKVAEYKVVITEKITETEENNQTVQSKTAQVKITNKADNVELTNGAINNTPIKGKISFIKQSYWGTDGLIGLNKPLEGIKFGLYRKIGSNTSSQAAYEAVSGAAGEVKFSDVEYGDYVLKEIDTPKGYSKFNDITILRTDLLPAGSTDQTFDYTTIKVPASAAEGIVQNVLRRSGDIDFKKVIDGKGVKDVGFTLYRRGDVVADDGKDMVLDVPSSTTTYGRYIPASGASGDANIVSGQDGAFHLSNLPLGDYIMIETQAPSNLQDDKQKLAVKFTLQNGSGNGDLSVSEIWVCDSLDYSINNDSLAVNPSTPAPVWKTPSKSDSVYQIENHEKYGFVQLNKVFADVASDGTLINAGLPKGAATFKVTDANSFELYLKTDKNGRFTPDKDGYYTDVKENGNGTAKKHLHYGAYTIREVTPPAGGIADTRTYSFTISEDKTGHAGTAWITSGQTTPTYVKAGGAEPSDMAFQNILARQTLSLAKTGTGSNPAPQTGAQFVVKAGGTAVASFEESTTVPGSYTLSNKKADGGIYQVNDTATTGQPFLRQDTFNQQFYLLAGTYTVEETVPPAGYQVAASFTVKIEVNGTVKVNGSTAAVSGTGITLTDAPIAVTVKKVDGTNTAATLDGVEFKLFKAGETTAMAFRKEADGYIPDASGSVTTLTTAGGGLIPFYRLPMGDYVLKEHKPLPGYQSIAGDISFTVTKEGKLSGITGAGASGNNGTELTVKNAPNSLTITKKFFNGTTEQTTNLPAGVKFGLYQDDTQVLLETVSNGKAVFHKIPDGSYTLREADPDDAYIPLTGDLASVTVENGVVTLGALNTDNTEALTNGLNAGLTVNNYQRGRFEFTKKGLQGEVVDGAVFPLAGVTDTAFMAEQVSDASGEVLFTGLVPGEYTLTEKTTKDGYAIKEDAVTVTVDVKGIVTFKNGTAELADTAALEALLENRLIPLEISKLDQDGNPLSGVELTLAGKLVGAPAGTLRWMTKETPEDLTGKLIGGETYTLTETKRVEGYLTAKPMEFTVANNGTITAVSGFAQGENTLVDGSIAVLDVRIQGGIALQKWLPAGDTASYTGITFDLYKSKTPVDLTDPEKLPEAKPGDDSVEKSGITPDTFGKALVENLEEGYYYFVETATRDDLYLDATPSAVVYIGEAQHGAAKVPVEMRNEAFETNVTLTKVDADDGAAVANTEFTLYREDGDWQIVDTYTTDNKGLLSIKLTQKGQYRLVETTAAKGYVLGTDAFEAVFTVENTADFQKKTLDLSAAPAEAVEQLYELTVENAAYRGEGLANTRQLGTLTLKKEDAEDQSALNGVTFTLSKKDAGGVLENLWDFLTGNSYQKVSDTQWDEAAGSDGELKLENLPWGEYRIAETKWLDGYKPEKDVYVDFTIGKTDTDVVLDVTANTIKNTRTTVNIAKVSENGVNLAGAELKLTGEFADGAREKTWNSATSAYELKGLMTAGKSYTLTEVKAPAGFKLRTDSVTLTMGADGNLTGGNLYELVNEPITLKITKRDSISGEALAGVAFALYRDGTAQKFTTNADGVYLPDTNGIAALATDENGEINFTRLPAGDYVLKEHVPLAGYAKLTADITFTVKNDGTVDALSGAELGIDKAIAVKNAPNSLTITKKFFNGTTEQTTGLSAGVKFGLYQGDTQILLETVSNGKAVFHKIPDGSYTLREIATAEGYILPEGDLASVTVANGVVTLAAATGANAVLTDNLANGVAAEATVSNFAKLDLRFKKQNDDGDGINGAVFQLAGVTDTAFMAEQVSNASGEVLFTGLVPGEYILTEKTTKDGYAIKEDAVTVTVDVKGVVTFKNGTAELADTAALEALFQNRLISLEISKLDQDGNPLSGVELTLAGKLVGAPAGTLRWMTKETPEDLTGKLIGGERYTLTETKRVEGYLTAKPMEFTVGKNGTITPVSGFDSEENTLTGSSIAVLDVRIQGGIALQKRLPAGDTAGYTGITFDLYKSKTPVDLTDPEKLPEAKPGDDSVEKSGITLDTFGKALVENLEEGYYYFVETATRDDLYLDTTPSAVVYIGEAQHGAAKVPVEMRNEAFEADLVIKKVDGDDGAEIANTAFTLYRLDGEKRTEAASGLTNAEGLLRLNILAKGTYVLAETAAAKGYVLGDDVFEAEFTVDNTKEFQNSTLDLRTSPGAESIRKYGLALRGGTYRNEGLANTRQLGTLTLKKEDAESQSALNGVTFTLSKKDAGGVLENLWDFLTGNSYQKVSDTQWDEAAGSDGELKLENLPWGEYRIAETKWLDGYKPEKDVYFDFTIGKTATDVVLDVTKDTIKNTRTTVSVAKVSENGVNLAGAELKLTGEFADGAREKTWNSATSAYELKGLMTAGKSYTLTETKAPAGYKLRTDSVTLTMGADGNLTGGNLYELVNEPIQLLVQKFSPQGEKLKGCVFGVTGVFAPLNPQARTAAGTIETIIVDDDHPDALEGRLIPGNEYVLQEMTAPLGYVVGGAVTFTVDEGGEMKLLSSSTEYVTDENGNIQMTDDPTTLRFAKVDENGKYIDGAAFTVEGLFADGTNKKTFSPTAQGALAVDELFVEGQRYTLTESGTPAGYQPMKDAFVFDFEPGNLVRAEEANKAVAVSNEKVNETIEKTVYTITVLNHRIPAEPTPGATAKPSPTPGSGGPATGDDRSAGVLVATMLFSAGAGMLLIAKRRKKSK